jgi:hypothetical protein
MGWIVALAAAAGTFACAQQPAAGEAALAGSAAEELVQFAKLAASNKIGTRAKQAYELALEYAPEHEAAHDALGHLRIGGKWQPARKPPPFLDNGNQAQREKVAAAWAATRLRLGALHCKLGLELVAGGNRADGERHLARALEYHPEDQAAHQGLGHEQRDDFFGTPEEIAFLDRLRAIERTAKELAQKPYATEKVPAEQLPAELQKSGLEFHGAKSAHFTIWMRGDDAAASECAQWAERALALLEFLLGAESAKVRPLHKLSYKWIAFTWSAAERDQLLQQNPEIWRGQEWTLVRRFDDYIWPERGQQSVVIWTTPATIHDRMVGFVWFQGFLLGRNEGLGEGLLHVGTQLLLGTTHTWYGAMPSTKSTSDKLARPSAEAWLQQLREQLDRGQDLAIRQVAREVRTHYRPQARIKAWNWMLWLLARHPDQWLLFVERLSAQKQLLPEAVDGIAREVFGRPLDELEQEWRPWAAGKSSLAKASGHGIGK